MLLFVNCFCLSVFDCLLTVFVLNILGYISLTLLYEIFDFWLYKCMNTIFETYDLLNYVARKS